LPGKKTWALINAGLIEQEKCNIAQAVEVLQIIGGLRTVVQKQRDNNKYDYQPISAKLGPGTLFDPGHVP
jgi:hypothetical protein